MKPTNNLFTVEIVSRGEGLNYTDAEGIFRFDIDILQDSRSTIVLRAYKCSDIAFITRQLSDEQRQRIIPRIVEYLQRKGSRVTVQSEAPCLPLHSVDDILRERFREREKRLDAE